MQINCDRKFNIVQHIKTALHLEHLKKYRTDTSKQQTIVESIASTSKCSEQQQFNFDLCITMMQCNIPLSKVNLEPFRSFLAKYSKQRIPDESTLRKNYVGPVYVKILKTIRNTIGDNHIWFSVDETTDSCGRYVANLIVGVLNEETPTKGFLISCKQLDKTNHTTISRFVSEGLVSFFLPEAVPNEKILLMLTDAAAYMTKSASALKIFYPNLIHCTCLAHGVNRVAEHIRSKFPLVNDLISSGKRIFVKAPLRVQAFKDKLPNTPLPPEPVLTRWGTWLDAAIYYANYFEGFKTVVSMFPDTLSKAIQDCKLLFIQHEVVTSLTFLKSHYSYISETIKQLETQQVPLTESIGIINALKNKIYTVPGPVGEEVRRKFDEVLNKNEGFQTLTKISSVLAGSTQEELNMNPNILAKFKYAPITSVDVERSFSAYKNILTDRRRNLTMEHLEQYLVTCFSKDI